MKISFPCAECGDTTPREEVLVEIRNDSLYDLTCSKGHKTKAQLRILKFEVLFDLGAMALLDGYTREAVASIAASLERFYEFYVEVIRLKCSIPDEEFDKIWNLLSKQSERQLGAFMLLYLNENKYVPSVFEDFFKKKKVSTRVLQQFRNDVIHAGYIPSHEEVIEYGEHVLSFMFSILKELKAKSKQFVEQAIKKYSFAAFGGGMSPGVRVGVISASIINLSMPFPRTIKVPTREEKAAGISHYDEEQFGTITFKQGLEYIARDREKRYYK